ncbi:zinc-ribbon domain-containing protein [Pseudarthrobacter sp. AB1]|uniref:zinc-ribbon domain-containing protein n=1 Tax=Pseudarthrobacter sp. AB1 TaxID=2138309 RepID=UPI00186B59AB|nr:zinc-ribbon domain-containing protein [Pseudarthrobacter sp. AB1]MBE4719868.1 hypothetical protein [Pseudarthrobacter sp. AB1]
MPEIEPIHALPVALRIKAWHGETVYSFASRLERSLHASKGVIGHLAYLDVTRSTGKRATAKQTTERMVTLCEAMCVVPAGTLNVSMKNLPFASHLCSECVGDQGAEYVWNGGRHTCAIHNQWIGPAPAPTRPSRFEPHPAGDVAVLAVSQAVVDADLRLEALQTEGRVTRRLVDEVVHRVDSERSQTHWDSSRPEDLPTVAAVLATITDPEVQTAVLDETVPFTERYARLATALAITVPACTPGLCDQVWLLLRPTAVWVRTTHLGQPPVDSFEPALTPAPTMAFSAPRHTLEPFSHSMSCLQTVGKDGDRWWQDRYMIVQPSGDPAFLLICDDGHVQRTQKAHARRFRTEAFHCTICTGQRVVAGINSLGDVMPELALEWDQAANGDLTPYMVSRASNKKVGWICKEDHHYPAYIANRTLQGTGCPDCASRAFQPGIDDLATVHPDLAALWDYTANGNLEPGGVSASSQTVKVHLRCRNGHPFVRTPADLVRYDGRCQTCVGRILIPGVNDLATVRPDVASWWHPTRNGHVTPGTVKPGSELVVWWQCDDGHAFPAMVAYRCNQKKRTCPVDTGHQLLIGVNDIASKEPDLVKDWDHSLNGTDPTQTLRGNKKWWWTCRFGHTKQARVANRRRSGGCPDCAVENRLGQPKRGSS